MKYLNSIKVVLVLLIIVLPWTITTKDQSLEIESISDELGFYQSNTCTISLFEFYQKNFNTTYQNHYRVNLNFFSPTNCFGRLTGIDRVGDTFYISVGANTYLSYFFISLFFIFIISLVKKNNAGFLPEDKFYFLAILLTTLLITSLIKGEKRYYQNTLFDLKYSNLDDLKTIFVFILFTTYFLVKVFNYRYKTLINFFPFLFLFVGVPIGLNFYIYFSIFIFIGVYKTLSNYRILNKFLLYLILIFIWVSSVNDNFGVYNSTNNFYLKPDKIVGSISTEYTILTIVLWSLVFFLSVVGIYFHIYESKKSFDPVILNRNFLNISSIILLFSFLAAHIPLINFITYFYFGLNKIGTPDLPNNFFDNWRGLLSSAELLGELFGLTLVLTIYLKIKNKLSFNFQQILQIFITLFGLILSTNRMAILLLFIFFFYAVVENLKITKKNKFKLLITFFIIILMFLNLSNQIYPLSFTSEKIINESLCSVEGNIMNFENGFWNGTCSSNKDNYSRALNYVESNYGYNFIFSLIFGLISTIGFYLNRSELWGLFLARYNPHFKDFLFGTGPYQLSGLYNEVKIRDTYSFLLPHSSIIQVLIYFGFFGILFLVIKIIQFKNISGNAYKFSLLFLILNLIKSDSLIYFSMLYTIIFFYVISKSEKFDSQF